MDSFFYMVILAGAIAGASTGLLGVYIVGMRIPFIGTCISHAAMAGTIFALIAGFNPVIGAILLSVITSSLLAAVDPEKMKIDNNVSLAILFSLMLGLTFLGIGLTSGSRNEVLGMLWGSLLFVQKKTLWSIAILAIVLMAFCIAFNKELKAILFSRSIAKATGIHAGFVFTSFLILTGIILSVNLKAIGGLLIFSLITNPAAAAYQLSRGHKAVVTASILFGTFSVVAGFMCSFYLDLPTGACIVIVSTIIFALCAAYRLIKPL